LDRDRIWTESIAVGRPAFLASIGRSIHSRSRNLEVVSGANGMCSLEVARTPNRMRKEKAGDPPRVSNSLRARKWGQKSSLRPL
jgi:hypothetical protein